MTEADREDGLAGDPSVRDDADEILGREGFKHGDKELDGVLVLAELLLQQEELVMEDVLTVHVLHEDPECLRVGMDLLIPLKIWSQSQLHPQS